MVALRPSVASYARIAYARELLGDLRGARAAMQLAADAASGQREPAAWANVELAKLELRAGRSSDAPSAQLRVALALLPGYVLRDRAARTRRGSARKPAARDLPSRGARRTRSRCRSSSRCSRISTSVPGTVGAARQAGRDGRCRSTGCSPRTASAPTSSRAVFDADHRHPPGDARRAGARRARRPALDPRRRRARLGARPHGSLRRGARMVAIGRSASARATRSCTSTAPRSSAAPATGAPHGRGHARRSRSIRRSRCAGHRSRVGSRSETQCRCRRAALHVSKAEILSAVVEEPSGWRLSLWTCRLQNRHRSGVDRVPVSDTARSNQLADRQRTSRDRQTTRRHTHDGSEWRARARPGARHRGRDRSPVRRPRGAGRRERRQPPGGAADLARSRSGHQRLLPVPQLRAGEVRPGRADHERQSRRGAELGPELLRLRPERHVLVRDRQRPRRQGGRRPLRRPLQERDPRLHEGSRPAAALHRRRPAAVVDDVDDPGNGLRQTYEVCDERHEAPRGLAARAAGQRRAPHDAELRGELPLGGLKQLDGGIRVFAGPRDDPFYIDLGAALRHAQPEPVRAAARASTCSPGTTCTRSRSRCRWR